MNPSNDNQNTDVEYTEVISIDNNSLAVSKEPPPRGLLLSYVRLVFTPTTIASYPRDNISYIAYVAPQDYHNLYRQWHLTDTTEITIPCVLGFFDSKHIPEKTMPDHDEINGGIIFTKLIDETFSNIVKCVVNLEGVVALAGDYWVCSMSGTTTAPTALSTPNLRDKNKELTKIFKMDYISNTVNKVTDIDMIEQPPTQIEIIPE